MFSIAIYTPIAIYDAPQGGGIFDGWSNVTIWVAVFGAAGGVLVALVVKYTDSIIKVRDGAWTQLLCISNSFFKKRKDRLFRRAFSLYSVEYDNGRCAFLLASVHAAHVCLMALPTNRYGLLSYHPFHQSIATSGAIIFTTFGGNWWLDAPLDIQICIGMHPLPLFQDPPPPSRRNTSACASLLLLKQSTTYSSPRFRPLAPCAYTISIHTCLFPASTSHIGTDPQPLLPLTRLPFCTPPWHQSPSPPPLSPACHTTRRSMHCDCRHIQLQ